MMDPLVTKAEADYNYVYPPNAPLWEDGATTITRLKQHLIQPLPEYLPGISIGPVHLLGDAFRQAMARKFEENEIEATAALLLAFAGMELEGQEISFGIVYVPRTTVPEARPSPAHLGDLPYTIRNDDEVREALRHFGHFTFNKYRALIRHLRAKLLGWVPGGYLEPILLVKENANNGGKVEFEPDSIKILDFAVNSRCPADSYRALTAGNDIMAIWIKPCAAIRIYCKGEFHGQIMRLRDAGGWATRNVRQLTRIITSVASRTGFNATEEFSKSYRTWIAEPAISLSECRRGGCLIVMKREEFDRYKFYEGDSKTESDPERFLQVDYEHASGDGCPNAMPTEFENLLRQDGSVIITPDGCVLAAGVYVRGGLGRKRTAWDLPGRCQCFTVVVSQDGMIYLNWRATDGRKGVRLDFIPTEISLPIERGHF